MNPPVSAGVRPQETRQRALRRVLVTIALTTLAGFRSWGQSGTLPPQAGPDRRPDEHVVYVTRDVEPGDYVHVTDPACAEPVEAGMAQLVASYSAIREDWIQGYAGPLFERTGSYAAERVRVRLEGTIGALLSPFTQPKASCVLLAAAVPKDAVDVTAELEARESQSRDWRRCSGDRCLEGWAAFLEPRSFDTTNGKLVVVVFKNWSHDRRRTARLRVNFRLPGRTWSPPADSLSLLQVSVPRFPRTDDEATAAIRDIVQLLPPRPVSPVGVASIAELIEREFGLPAVTYPRFTETIDAEIRLLNPPNSPLPLLAEASVLIPSLPAFGGAQADPKRNARGFTQMDLSKAAWVGLDSGTKRAVWVPSSARESVVAGQFVQDIPSDATSYLLDVWLSPAVADRLWAFRPFAALRGLRYASAPLDVEFDQAGPGTPYSLNQGVKARLAAILSAQPRRQVDLLILDSGWPTAANRAAAYAWFNKMTAAASKAIGLNPAAPLQPSAPFTDAQIGHSTSIDKSLAPFREIDTFASVREIYLPLTNDQGSRTMLVELIRLAEIARYTDDRDAGPAPATLRRADQTAKRIVDQLPPVTRGSELRTDKAVVEALLVVLELAGTSLDRYFVLNESWTARTPVNQFASISNTRVFTVAAAGNKSILNVFSNDVEFARRSLTQMDTLAVVNMNEAGSLQCESSRADTPNGDPLIAGFDGRIDSNSCGTSFAAPRVAWVLAAAEAYRTEVLYTPAAWQSWLSSKVRKSRGPRGSPLEYHFDPAKVISGS